MPTVIHELVTPFVNDFRKCFRKSSLIDRHLYFHLWECLKPALSCFVILALGRQRGINRQQEPKAQSVGAALTTLHLPPL